MNGEKTPSAEQTAANRQNSKSSTGPRTAAGKKNVSLNALKHGFYAKDLIIRDENKAEIQELEPSFSLSSSQKPHYRNSHLRTSSTARGTASCRSTRHAPRQQRPLYARRKKIVAHPGRNPAIDGWFTASPEQVRKGTRILDNLMEEIQQTNKVSEESTEAVRKVFGESVAAILREIPSQLTIQALMLARVLETQARRLNMPIHPLCQEIRSRSPTRNKACNPLFVSIDFFRFFLGEIQRRNRLPRDSGRNDGEIAPATCCERETKPTPSCSLVPTSGQE